MSNLSLISILREDPDFGRRITKKVEEIKQDKKNLLAIADDYGKKYEQEILEGTEKRAKLLTEGAERGLTEEQVMSQYHGFIPTVYTPILNFLYFMLRETEVHDAAHYRRRDAINEALVKARQLSHEDAEADLSDKELESLLEETLRELKEDTAPAPERVAANKRFEDEKQGRSKEKLKDTPEMVEYLYGNITLETFDKIKKLKALSKSPNEREAFQAYRKALELCKKYNLEFDRIPCYVKGQNE